jgi:hypothetical protein
MSGVPRYQKRPSVHLSFDRMWVTLARRYGLDRSATGNVDNALMRRLVSWIDRDAKWSAASKKTYISVVLNRWRRDNPEKRNSVAPDEARAIQKIAHYRETVNRVEKDNKASSSERGRLYSFAELRAMLAALGDRYGDYIRDQQRLALALYLELPLRKDFGCVQIIRNPDDWRGSDDPLRNLLHLTGDGTRAKFLLRRDKVMATIGPTDFTLSEETTAMIRAMDKCYGERPWLLTSPSSVTVPLDALESLDKRGTYDLLRSIPSPDGRPSKLSVDSIRTAFANHYLADATLSESALENVARRMRTSLAMLRQRYRKIDI